MYTGYLLPVHSSDLGGGPCCEKTDHASDSCRIRRPVSVIFVCELLPDLLVGTDFKIDYGFIGVLLPVLVYFSRKKVLFLGMGLMLLALGRDATQWWALAALPLLMLYNHQRGSWKIGPLFYFYYPAHLAVLYGIKLFIT